MKGRHKIQRRVAKRWASIWQFWLLLLFTGIIFARELIHVAVGQAYYRNSWLLGADLVGIGPSVSLLVGALTLLIVRNQFALGLRPYISYRSRWVTQGDDVVFLTSAAPPVWTVTAKNVGPGLGVIRDVRASVKCITVKEGEPHRFSGTINDLVRFLLGECGLELNRQYAITLLSPGAAIASGDEVRVFELITSASDKVEELVFDVEIEGALKDIFYKAIFCIPPRGLPPVPR
ncbi:MAG: hypothetical protein ACRDQ4_27275 [Pseudonocardiaceae bacterium]